jgi:hypothetical protein
MNSCSAALDEDFQFRNAEHCDIRGEVKHSGLAGGDDLKAASNNRPLQVPNASGWYTAQARVRGSRRDSEPSGSLRDMRWG